MKNKIILLLLVFPMLLSAQKTDQKLLKLIQNEIKTFQGDIGVYVYHFKSKTEVNIAGDTIFPTASIVKVPILVGVFNEIEKGNLKLNQTFKYDAKRVYGGSGLMQFYKDSAQTDLSTMISLMLTYSDNVTSIWLQELAGGGEKINSVLEKYGFDKTKVNSRTKGREDLWKQYGWGQTSPKEMAVLFKLIREGKIISPKISDKMYRYLKNQYYNERSLSQIPAHINTISKTGSVNQSRGEVVLVNAPSGDYVFCILTKNNKDQSWTAKNEAEVLTRKLSNIIWNHYEPKQNFTAQDIIE